MKVRELLEAASFKLYTENPYGNGFDDDPVKRGEVLSDEDGNFKEFVGITTDGKRVIVKVDGKKQEISPSDLGGKILPAGQKPNEK